MLLYPLYLCVSYQLNTIRLSSSTSQAFYSKSALKVMICIIMMKSFRLFEQMNAHIFCRNMEEIRAMPLRMLLIANEK